MLKAKASILLDILIVGEVEHTLHNILHSIVLEYQVPHATYPSQPPQTTTILSNVSDNIACRCLKTRISSPGTHGLNQHWNNSHVAEVLYTLICPLRSSYQIPTRLGKRLQHSTPFQLYCSICYGHSQFVYRLFHQSFIVYTYSLGQNTLTHTLGI